MDEVGESETDSVKLGDGVGGNVLVLVGAGDTVMVRDTLADRDGDRVIVLVSVARCVAVNARDLVGFGVSDGVTGSDPVRVSDGDAVIGWEMVREKEGVW